MINAALSPMTVLLALIALALFALGIGASARVASDKSLPHAKHSLRDLLLAYSLSSAAFSALFLTLFSALGLPSLFQMLPLALALGVGTLLVTTLTSRIRQLLAHAVYGDPAETLRHDPYFLARLSARKKSNLALAAAISGVLFCLAFYFYLGSWLPSTLRLFLSIGAGVGGAILGYAASLNYLIRRGK